MIRAGLRPSSDHVDETNPLVVGSESVADPLHTVSGHADEHRLVLGQGGTDVVHSGGHHWSWSRLRHRLVHQAGVATSGGTGCPHGSPRSPRCAAVNRPGLPTGLEYPKQGARRMLDDQTPSLAVQPLRTVHHRSHAVRVHKRHPPKVQPYVTIRTQHVPQRLIELIASGKIDLAGHGKADRLSLPGDQQRVSGHAAPFLRVDARGSAASRKATAPRLSGFM